MKGLKIQQGYRKFLPSKRFAIWATSLCACAFVVFLIFSYNNKKHSVVNKNTTNGTLSDLLQLDTDEDGVYNWKEALWGTDENKKVTFGEIPDAVYIKQKEDALKTEEGQDIKTLNETEQFAREFFASYVALQAAGESTETIKKIGEKIGEKIGDPTLENKYSKKDLNISSEDNYLTTKTYYEHLQELFDKYRNSGMGEEINIVNSGVISNGTKESFSRLNKISKIYKDFAVELINVPVPETYAEQNLKIANAAHNTGVSVLGMINVTDDPIVGLNSLAQYKKYSEELASSAGELEEELIYLLE